MVSQFTDERANGEHLFRMEIERFSGFVVVEQASGALTDPGRPEPTAAARS
jgi:hypothetical protein